jgi:hypothetical protein
MRAPNSQVSVSLLCLGASLSNSGVCLQPCQLGFIHLLVVVDLFSVATLGTWMADWQAVLENSLTLPGHRYHHIRLGLSQIFESLCTALLLGQRTEVVVLSWLHRTKWVLGRALHHQHKGFFF